MSCSSRILMYKKRYDLSLYHHSSNGERTQSNVFCCCCCCYSCVCTWITCDGRSSSSYDIIIREIGVISSIHFVDDDGRPLQLNKEDKWKVWSFWSSAGDLKMDTKDENQILARVFCVCLWNNNNIRRHHFHARFPVLLWACRWWTLTRKTFARSRTCDGIFFFSRDTIEVEMLNNAPIFFCFAFFGHLSDHIRDAKR
jgi:hypothetical protein